MWGPWGQRGGESVCNLPTYGDNVSVRATRHVGTTPPDFHGPAPRCIVVIGDYM